MNEFLKMDIFFVVTTIAIVIVAGLLSIAIWKLLRILDHVERIAKVAGKEAENIREDAAYVRGRLLGVLDALFSFVPRRRRTRTKEPEIIENDEAS